MSVRVLPDTSAFGRSLSRYLARIERSTQVRLSTVLDDSSLVADARALARLVENTARVTLPAEVDDTRARLGMRALVRELSGQTVRVDVDVNKAVAAQIRAIGDGFTRLSRVSLNIGGLASAVPTLAGVAAAAVQASGALLLLPAAGVAAGAAIGTLALGLRGFGDALSNLNDPAKFAAALGGLAPSARETAQAIKDLQPGFTALRLDVQDRLFAGLAATIGQLATAYLPLLRTGLGGIATELNTTARGFAAFLTSPQTLADTSTILGNVRAALAALAPAGVSVAHVFRDIAAVGSGFLPGLAASLSTAAQRFAEFIAAARESGRLQGWIAGGVSAVAQLGAILGNLGSIIASVFGALDASGAGFVALLADATGQLADFLESAEGAQVLGALAEFAATAGQVLSGVLGAALTQLAPVLVQLAPALGQFVTQLGGALVAALAVAGPLLAQFARFLADNASWLGPIVIGLGTLAAVAGPLVSALTFLANTVRIVTLVFQALRIALLSNPFTAIALGITALAVLVVTHWEEIRTATINAWRAVSEWVRARVQDVVAVAGLLGQLPGRIGAWFRGVYDGAVTHLSNLVSWVRGLPGMILGALGDLGSLLVNAGRNIIQGLINGLRQAGSAVRDFLLGLVQDAVGGVLGYLGIASPSRLMQQIGSQTAQGFATGIANGIPLAARAANQLATAATFDPAQPELVPAGSGTGGPVTVNQTINTQPGQSEWAIATAANRQLGYALRTTGLP